MEIYKLPIIFTEGSFIFTYSEDLKMPTASSIALVILLTRVYTQTGTN
jgi:hypothetical protein